MTKREQDLFTAAEKIDHSAKRISNLQVGSAVYQQEIFALIELIYLYLNHLSEKYVDKGLEIVETVYDCLKYYDPRKGPFRNYFMATIRRRIATEDLAVAQQRGGIVLSRLDRQKIKAIIAISHKIQCPLDAEQLPTIAAEILQESPETIQRLLSMNAAAVVISTSSKTEWEKELESIPSEQQLENEVLDKLGVEELFQKINRSYQSCRQIQKEVISKLLTAKILAESPYLVKEWFLWKYDFWDLEIYRNYLSGGSVPSARQISADLALNEASASRTFSRFLQKINIDRKDIS